ncbi:CocE/NonD family hydrolase [Alkalilimnicola ehrlichii MLHE-1]|uniref:Peptidase S15 n=1 Tax=Alkalilimnicola ehrlichii (strain ATCC BAA-1101 / DSM 17681 / MLHE-1) TaxID=187272 RepID=Q0AA75_ALKEH|nr:CocE/NonD family hydrolase [Alkalilimnicola ehrlichii]ABI56262.1 peptidase S15 [Alkalilimnicola ehrlichii MLHE-1]
MPEKARVVPLNDLPERIRVVENLWIPMPDGVQLAARAWIPESAVHQAVPAILEYIPYRKREFTRQRDDATHAYLAGHGYACVRVDIRGSGESDGVLTDEYLPIELEDGEVILRWLAEQDWCNGRVGMIGISWGGFNGLQLAARQPKELGAIVTVCSTDDRYTDDVHYMGGCLLGDNLSWASAMYSHSALPPDPAIVGDSWRETWHRRMEGSGFWLEDWLSHQRRDDYWRHGSINEDYGAVQIPVMAVSGWADGYSNSVFRMLEHLPGPRMGLVGPWGHKYPHQGIPGPAIDFLGEVLRWFDRWLKDEPNGVEAEPMLRAWVQDTMPPITGVRHRPGRWVAEPGWPSPGVRRECLDLRPGQIGNSSARPAEHTDLTLQSPLSVGLFAGRWCSFSATPDLPHDQREEDGGALIFTSDPLEQPLELLGQPAVTLEVASDKPVAQVAVRLSEVAESDEATRLTYGLLNLTHRNGHEDPEPLEPGRFYTVRVKLNDIGQRIPAGHRLRVSISTSYWPLAWPAPESPRLTFRTQGCCLELPVRESAAEEENLRRPGPPVQSPGPAMTLLQPRDYGWTVTRDLASDRSTLEVKKDEGAFQLDEIGMGMRIHTVEWYSHTGNQYDSVRGETRAVRELRREGWQVRVETRTVLTSDAGNFHLRAEMDAYEGDERVHAHNISRSIPRDLI